MNQSVRPQRNNPFAWLGGQSHLVLLACLIVAGGGTAFFGIADLVEDGTSQRFDEWALRAFRRSGDPSKMMGPKWTEEAARDITAMGGVAVLTLITLAVAGHLLLDRRYSSLLLLLGATMGGLAFNTLLKHLYRRPRPQVVPHLSDVYTTSFPSGHSMLSATVYLTLGALLARFVKRRIHKFYFVTIALLLTLLVGLSRVVMGVHWPTDVLAGWSAGLAWALLCWLAARFLQRHRIVERAEESPNDEGSPIGQEKKS